MENFNFEGISTKKLNVLKRTAERMGRTEIITIIDKEIAARKKAAQEKYKEKVNEKEFLEMFGNWVKQGRQGMKNLVCLILPILQRFSELQNSYIWEKFNL